jgi:glycosyltransferase involved in cell wall biosynthesis
MTSVTKAMKLMRSKAELIIVNDCSPKWSEEEKAVPEGDNIQVVHHLENKGLGAARNTGFRYAQGKRVWFVDSDDSINPSAMTMIMKYLKEYEDADIIQLGAMEIFMEGHKEPMFFNYHEVVNFVGKSVFSRWLTPSVWSKIYKRSFLKENDLWNPEGILCEDQEFFIKCILKANRIVKVPVVAYNYFHNPGSIMESPMDVRHVVDWYKVAIICTGLLKPIPDKDKEYLLSTYQGMIDRADEGYKSLNVLDKLKVRWKMLQFYMNLRNNK